METNRIVHGDCKEVLKGIESDSVDLIVTDPPYFMVNDSGSGFMGKSWDSASDLWRYLWSNPEYVDFVEKFLMQLRVGG